jgi:endonuclease/exonuclease/phosphatase family metal-dependent hydrolase
MIVTIEAFMRKMWRAFNPDEWMTRLLRLPKTEQPAADAAPGLVMIQIDGLGFTQFQRAMKQGHMPFLSRLLKREGYANHPHYTGLPSNTPAVQGMLFYGVKSCVPAFSFKDRTSGKVVNMFTPESAAAVEARIQDQGEPLMKDGSAYGNIFTGGAKEAHFCAASMGWGGLLKSANTFGVAAAIMLNLNIFIRAIFLIQVEMVLAVVDSVWGILRGKKLMSELGFIPLRVAVCVLLREIIAAGARIDITRGLPVIHMNLGGFDEQAHHRGPTSTFAHWSLRGIDAVIARVWKAAQRAELRHYDVFVYSDHGQEETVGYDEECGRSIEEAVNLVLEDKVTSDRQRSNFEQGVHYWRAAALRSRSGDKPRAAEAEDKDAAPRAVVAAMGPVGHVYPAEALSMEAKEKIAAQLVASAKIPFVMIPDGPGRALAWNSQGRFAFPEEADKVIESSHPFFTEVTRDLVELCHHPDAGEWVLFGWRKGRKSLTFYTSQGSHAGPGPEETNGFALLPMGALPRSFTAAPNKAVHTQDIRDAAFRAQGRKLDKAPGKADTAPVPPANTDWPAEDPQPLRIMTYNVHRCMGRDGKISPERIAKIIARHDPDILALQELSTNEHAHQAEIIARSLAMTYQYHPCLTVKRGQRGNAIFSKHPMRLVRDGILPKLPRTPYLEPRGAMWVEIDARGVKIQVFNTHLSLSPTEGLLQIKALCGPDWLGSSDCRGPVIFCGDLNALSRSKICGHLGQRLKNTHFELSGHRPLKTIPSYFPLGLVDHIFADGKIRTTRIEVPRMELERMASDHLPLIVDVELSARPISVKSSTFPDTRKTPPSL